MHDCSFFQFALIFLYGLHSNNAQFNFINSVLNNFLFFRFSCKFSKSLLHQQQLSLSINREMSVAKAPILLIFSFLVLWFTFHPRFHVFRLFHFLIPPIRVMQTTSPCTSTFPHFAQLTIVSSKYLLSSSTSSHCNTTLVLIVGNNYKIILRINADIIIIINVIIRGLLVLSSQRKPRP